jgi:hypothetical protein
MGRIAAIENALAAGTPPVLVVSLSGPAGLWRVAPTALELPDAEAQGGLIRIEAGLVSALPFADTLDPFAVSALAGLQQAQVQVLLEPYPLSTLGGIQEFTASRVEVALTWPDLDWSRRRVLLAGTLQGLSFQGEGRPITFTAENTPPISSGLIGNQTRDLGEYFPNPTDTGGNALAPMDGYAPLIVLGRAKRIPGFKIGASGGNNRLFLCEHELPAGAVSYRETYGITATATPATGTGPNGTYRYLASASAFLAADEGYTWDADYGGLEGSITAADVLRLLLRSSGLRIDAQRNARALSLLRGWEIGLWIDQQAPIISIIRERLLPFLPLVEVNGQDGLWFAYVDPLTAPIVKTLAPGQGLLGRVGAVEVSDLDQIHNSFTISYGYDAATQTYQSSASLGWRERDSANARQAYSEPCRVSRQLYGDRAAELIECPIVWDHATAAKLLAWRTELCSLPHYRLSYLYDPAVCYSLEAGDVVTLTDPEFGISALRAVVVQIERTLEAPTLTLSLVPASPARF